MKKNFILNNKEKKIIKVKKQNFFTQNCLKIKIWMNLIL